MSITKENQLQSQINNLKRRINCLCDAITSLEAQIVVDGNGIYGGSDNVPDNTVATLNGSFQIVGTGADREFYVEVGDGVDDLTQIDMSPTQMTIGHVSSADSSTIVFNSSGVQVNNLNYAELNSTPADLDYSGLIASFTANENHGLGDAVFINGTNEAQLGDASTVATTYCVGIATGTVTAGNTGTYLLQGFVRNDVWNWTPGEPIFLSLTGTTTNTLTQTKPSATNEVVQLLGWALTADIIYWNPQLVQLEIA